MGTKKIIDYKIVEGTNFKDEGGFDYSKIGRFEEKLIKKTDSATETFSRQRNVKVKFEKAKKKKTELEYELTLVSSMLQSTKGFSLAKFNEVIKNYESNFNRGLKPLKSNFETPSDEKEIEKFLKQLQANIEEEIKFVTDLLIDYEMEMNEEKGNETLNRLSTMRNSEHDLNTSFELMVLYYLQEGYELQGGVFVKRDNSGSETYYQAMVKYEN